MTVKNNFTFGIAYANKKVRDKNTFNWGSLYYTNKPTNIEELVEKIKEGYPFTSMMKNHVFTTAGKTKGNFKQTSLIALDFDDCPDCFDKAYNDTDITPTIAYTTPNDQLKGNRFRFIYVFSEPIRSTDEYHELYDTITTKLGLPTDDNLRSGVQNIGGMSSTGKLKASYKIYDKNDFVDNKRTSIERELNELAVKNNNREKEGRNGIVLNCQFEKDIDGLDFKQFLNKYRTVYQYFDHSELVFENGYALIPEDYYEIKRKWHRETIDTKNGERDVSVIDRLKDGQERRNKLFIQCLIRRKIKPEVTLEELVYNLVCERQYFFNNDDGQLSNREIIRIANNAMLVENITIEPTKTTKRFVIDKEYWSERGYTPNQAKQLVKKMMKDNEIGNLYDPELTDKQNLEVMRKYNVKCSQRTLTEWKKANGLTRKYNKK